MHQCKILKKNITRSNGRLSEQLRSISFATGFIEHHPGSVLVSFGKTRVLVTAISENRVPHHRTESKGGWLSAEYAMLPGSTLDRKMRPGIKGPDGRSIEIQRLIGRSLRQAVNLDKIGPRTINIDCDVICADGGTRTAAITGAWVALTLLLKHLIDSRQMQEVSLRDVLVRQIAAISLGIVEDQILTDLDYREDVRADTDFNLIACSDGSIVEFQGSAEHQPMLRRQTDAILDQGLIAISELCKLQQECLKLPIYF